MVPGTERAMAVSGHDALIYGSDGELLAAGVAFVRAGIAASETVIVHGPRDYVGAFRAALAADPRVQFTDPTQMYARPMSALGAYQTLFDRDLPEGAGLRAIGPVPFGHEPDSQARWARYEAVVNPAMAPYRFTTLCTYDERALPAAIIDVARATHPHIVTAGGRVPSSTYGPADVLRRYGQPEPDPREVGALRLELDAVSDLADVRQRLHEAAAELDPGWADNFVLAANEVVTNAIRHGAPPVSVRLWSGHRRLLLQVSDTGPGISDPLAGYESAAVSMRRGIGGGLWLVRQLVTDMTTVNTPAGCTVWLTMGD